MVFISSSDNFSMKIGTSAASADLPTWASTALWVLSANFLSSTSNLSRTSFWRAGGTVSSSRCDQPATIGCTALPVSWSAMVAPSVFSCS